MLLPLSALLPWTQNTRKILRKFLRCYGNQRQSSIFVPQNMYVFSEHNGRACFSSGGQVDKTYTELLSDHFLEILFRLFFMNFFLARLVFFTKFGPKIDEKIRNKII